MKPHGGKFILTLQSLAKSGRHWDVTVPVAEFVDKSFDALKDDAVNWADLSWKGSLLPSPEGFLLAGKWQLAVPRQCGRCNVDFAMDMQHDVQVRFALADAKQIEAQEESDSDVELVLPPGELDVLDVLREQFWLAWQPMAACSPDCKGLCPQCGLNLNDGKCDCHDKREDHPFAALQGLKFDA